MKNLFSRLRRVLLVALAASVLMLSACNDKGGNNDAEIDTLDLSVSVAAAVGWLDRPDLETASSLVMAGLQWIYDLSLAHEPKLIFEQHVSDLQASGLLSEAGALALFRRIYDRSAVLDLDLLPYLNSIDQRTLEALYCDTVPVPASYRDDLMTALELGGYEATHVLLAALFVRSNECTGIFTALDLEQIDSRAAAVIDLDDGFLDDLDIEAMALLAAGGRMDLIPVAARDALLTAQQADGSWAEQTPLDGTAGEVPGFQHASVLALWFLLAWQEGGWVPVAPRAP